MPLPTKSPLPNVSFVVPARNEERYIAACIASLWQQGIAGAEILVVDNGSSDATAAKACECGASVVVEPRAGLANARQAGLIAARGEVIIYVDADTRLPDGWAAEALRRFANDTRLVGLSSSFSFYDGRPVDRVGNLVFKALLNPATNFVLCRTDRPAVLIGSAIAVRAEALRRAGGVDPTFQFYGEDTMLACRLHSQGRVRFMRKPVHLTSARRYQQRGMLSVVYRYFLIFALIHLGKVDRASKVARRFQICERRRGGPALCRRRPIRVLRSVRYVRGSRAPIDEGCAMNANLQTSQ